MNGAITGVGSYLPEKVLTNDDMAKIVETSDEWITVRTGIKERHIAAEDERNSDMATEAAKEAISDAGISASDIELILVATVTQDMFTPSTSCVVQKNIEAINAAAIDVNAACAGFATALHMADQFIKCGTYKTILVIGSDVLSRITDWQDRKTCVLFGDGAGAVVMQATDDGSGILSATIGADGTKGHSLTAPNLFKDEEEFAKRISENKRTLWMDGSEVFKFAVRIMAEATHKVLEQAGLTIEDLDMVVPHQANIRIVEGATKRLKLTEDKVFTNLHKYGNMSSASIPVALCEAVKEGRIKSGDNVVMVGFGGGLTWAAVCMKWK